jgi:hypothetical protein
MQIGARLSPTANIPNVLWTKLKEQTPI